MLFATRGPPGVFVLGHVDQKFDAVESHSLCSLDSRDEENPAEDLNALGKMDSREVVASIG